VTNDAASFSGGSLSLDLDATSISSGAFVSFLSRRPLARRAGLSFDIGDEPSGSELSGTVSVSLFGNDFTASAVCELIPETDGDLADAICGQSAERLKGLKFVNPYTFDTRLRHSGLLPRNPFEQLALIENRLTKIVDYRAGRPVPLSPSQVWQLNGANPATATQSNNKCRADYVAYIESFSEIVSWLKYYVRNTIQFSGSTLVVFKNTNDAEVRLGLSIDSAPAGSSLLVTASADTQDGFESSNVTGLYSCGPAPSPTFSDKRLPLATGLYSNAPVESFGDVFKSVVIYRDGEYVSELVLPNGKLESNTQDEGSYLFVLSDVNSAAAPSVPQPLLGYASVVIDTTPPAVACGQAGDYFVGNPTNVRENYFFFVANEDGDFLPSFIQRGSLASPLMSLIQSPGGVTQVGSAGFYEQELVPSSSFQPRVFRDRAGNQPFRTARAELEIHAVPDNGKLGAQAKFWLPQFSNYVYDTPAPYCRLTFNKKVRGLKPRHFRLLSCSVGGVEEFVGDAYFSVARLRSGASRTEYQITLPSSPQAANRQLYLRYKPDAAVVVIPENVSEKFFAARIDFPDIGEPLTIYNDQATGMEYEWADGTYEVLDDGEVPGVEEVDADPCVLASRAMWITSQATGIGRELIDTSSRAVLLGSVASISTTAAEQTPPGDGGMFVSTITAAENAYIGHSAGTFSTAPRELFVPSVPPGFDGEKEEPYSYWGLRTSIYPSRPAALSECSVPGYPQGRSSVVVGNPNISAVTIQFVSDLFPDGGAWLLGSRSSYHPIVPNLYGQQEATRYWVPPGEGDLDSLDFVDGREIELTQALGGTPLQQNSFAAVLQVKTQVRGEQFNWQDTTQVTTLVWGEVVALRAALHFKRHVHEYGSLRTAAMTQLFANIHLTWVFNYDASGIREDAINNLFRQKYRHQRVVFTKQQETALASGATVTFPVADGSLKITAS